MTTHTDRPAAQRPRGVVAAIVLMLPAAVLWPVAGIAFITATARAEGTGKFLLWIIAVFILGICALLTMMTVSGMVQAWRGRPTVLRIPAGFTVGLLVLALINLIVQGKIEFHATMITPVVVGSLAGVALLLLGSRSAVAWLGEPARPGSPG